MGKKPKLHVQPALLRLDLGCGQNPREGFDGVDVAGTPKHLWDLTRYPWPFDDGSVEELHSSHFVEHLPADVVKGGPRDGQDHLFAFFDECYRVLVPGGKMTVVVPNARSNRAFQDPTHRRFIVAETFLYLAKEFREANKLDHYRVTCDFAVNVTPAIPVELSVMHPEVQARRINAEWNAVWDWHAMLVKK